MSITVERYLPSGDGSVAMSKHRVYHWVGCAIEGIAVLCFLLTAVLAVAYRTGEWAYVVVLMTMFIVAIIGYKITDKRKDDNL